MDEQDHEDGNRDGGKMIFSVLGHHAQLAPLDLALGESSGPFIHRRLDQGDQRQCRSRPLMAMAGIDLRCQLWEAVQDKAVGPVGAADNADGAASEE